MTKAYTDTLTAITEGPELDALVLMLQSKSPLARLSNMEARTVFELLLQRGYKIVQPAAERDSL
jgi:hypothetical protein